MEKEVHLIENMTSWQGEGVSSGQRMIILRFKRCNRIESGNGCPWCDTATKLRISQESRYKVSEIQKVINMEKAGIMITGGEPTYDNNFKETVLLLNNLEYNIANVETNGFNLIDLIKEVDKSKPVLYSYSPKIFTKKELKEEKERSKILSKYSNVYYKVVYEYRQIIHEYLKFLEELKIHNRVFLMPQGSTKTDLLVNAPDVFDVAEKYKFGFSSRNHIIYSFI